MTQFTPGASTKKYLPPTVRRKGNKNAKNRFKSCTTTTAFIGETNQDESEDGLDDPSNDPIAQSSGKLPKYPNANKQEYKDQKKIQKLEFETEDLYGMDPVLQKALDDEMAELCNAFVSACDELKDKNEEEVHERMTKKVVKDFKKVVKVHATRRLLNLTTNLTVRVFVSPKSTKPAVLENFLKSQGVVTFKKSEKNKMYLANCSSFETFDKLVALGSTKLGDAVVTLKPLHLVGPPIKKNKKSQQNVSNVEVTVSDDEVADEATTDKDEHNVSLGDQDVVVVETKNDVVVIEDDHNIKTTDIDDVNTEVADVKSNNTPNNEDLIINDENKHTIPSESAAVISKTNSDTPNNGTTDSTSLDNVCEATCDDEGNEKQDKSLTPSNENKLDDECNEKQDKSLTLLHENKPDKNLTPSDDIKLVEDILESVDVAEDDLEDF